MDYIETKIWICVDANGDYVASHSIDNIDEFYVDEVGGESTIPKRLIELVVKVPTPKQQVIRVTLPDEVPAAIEATVA